MDLNMKQNSVSRVSECKSNGLHLICNISNSYRICKSVSHILIIVQKFHKDIINKNKKNKRYKELCKTYTYTRPNILINSNLHCKPGLKMAYTIDNEVVNKIKGGDIYAQ